MQARLSTILEIVSAVAVVISLIFVGLEIRNSSEQTEQNTKALQISAYQDLISRIVEVNAIGITESLTVESLIEIQDPSSKDRDKLNSILWILFRHGDMAYFQYENGSISEERMLSAMAPLVLRLRYPVVVARWNESKDVFISGYRDYIDVKIQSFRLDKDGE